MAVNLSQLLSSNGINLSAGMTAEDILSLMSKVPQMLSLFPNVNAAVTTLQSVLDAFYRAQRALDTANDNLAKAEDALNKAQQLQTFMASQVRPVTTAPGKPTVPDVASGALIQTALQMAQQVVDKAEDVVKKAEEALEKAKEKVLTQIDTVVTKTFTEKV